MARISTALRNTSVVAFATFAILAGIVPDATGATSYGWQNLIISGPGARGGAVGGFLPASGRTVVFGGCNTFRSATLGVAFANGEQASIAGSWCDAADAPATTWALGKSWAEIRGIAPPPRWLAGMSYDSVAKALILFGGTIATHQDTGSAPVPPSPDAMPCVHGPAAPDAILVSGYDVPHPTAGITSMTYTDPTGRPQSLYMWCYHDTWTLRADANKKEVWTKQAPAHHPRARFDFPIGHDALGRTTLNDGCTAQGFVEQEDSAGKSTGYKQWDCFTYRYFKYPTGTPPPAYEYQETNYVRDTWHYQRLTTGVFDWVQDIAVSSPTWVGSCKDSRSPAPDCVRGTAGVFDPASSSFANAGGWVGLPGAYSTQGSLARITYWSGSSWAARGGLAFPRSWPMAAYAWIDGAWNVVVFGGYAGGTTYAGTALLSGVACTGSSCTSAPPARYSGVMVYDAARQRLVLYGGFGNAALGDTWVMPAPVPAGAPPACPSCAVG